MVVLVIDMFHNRIAYQRKLEWMICYVFINGRQAGLQVCTHLVKP